MYKVAYAPVDFVECDYCHRTMKGKAPDAGRAGWDWYTLPGKETVHACNICKDNKTKWKKDLEDMQNQAYEIARKSDYIGKPKKKA